MVYFNCKHKTLEHLFFLFVCLFCSFQVIFRLLLTCALISISPICFFSLVIDFFNIFYFGSRVISCFEMYQLLPYFNQ